MNAVSVSPRRLFLSAVATVFLFAFASCGGGGGSETETIMLRLNSEEPCYGIIVDVDTSDADQIECTGDPSRIDQGCLFDIDKSPDGFELSLHGCFTAEGDELFSCTVPSSVADDLPTSVEVRCGCGCADNCPDDPAIAVCDEDGAGCRVADRHVAVPQRTTSSTGRGVVVSSTTCGTCCDAGSDASARLTSGEGVRELRFEIEMGTELGVQCTIEDCAFPSSIDGPTSEEVVSDGKRRICIADPTALDAGELLLSCSMWTGGDYFQIKNVTATGEDLRPASPPPVLEVED